MSRVLLSLLGFTRAGVAAGSVAASMMGRYRGSVGKGSATAILQSIGTTGMSCAATVATATGGGFAGKIIHGYLLTWFGQ